MNKLAVTLACALLPALLSTPAQAIDFVPVEAPKGLFGRGGGNVVDNQRALLADRSARGQMVLKMMLDQGTFPLPRCTRAEGSLRIVEPDDGQALWGSYGLPMPTRMLRSFVTQSSCFRVLDRSTGFAAAQAERELASGGHLQSSANMGGGQMLAADFILIPDIVGQNANAGGSNAGASGRGLLGIGMLGGGGNRSTQLKTATVMLTLVDTRTSEVLATASGDAEMKDVKWNASLGGSAAGVGSASISAGAYENTEIGNVIRAAYQMAFHRMLFELEPMDLAAHVQHAPEATRQQQVAQTTAYSTGGSATQTTSHAPVQMQLDQQAAHMAAYQQQLQQQQQMYQMQQQQLQQQRQLQQDVHAAQAMGQLPVAGSVGQMAQMAMGQAVPQAAGQVMAQAGQALPAAAMQLTGQMLPEGSAQVVGQMAQGLQQGNLGQAVVQGAVQQFAGTAASTNAVLVLKVPAELAADASGGGAVVRLLQPGETLARLGLSPNGSMIQVRDGQGVIGWIPAGTHADLISIRQ